MQFEFHPEAFNRLLEIILTDGSFNILWTGGTILLTLIAVSPLKNKGLFLAPVIIVLTAIISVFVFSGAYKFLEDRTTINRSLLQAAPLLIFVCAILIESFIRSPVLNPPREKDEGTVS